MAETPSAMLPLGTPLPSFSLPDAVTGAELDSRTLEQAPGVLVMFLCNHCPFVAHLRPRLVPLAHQWMDEGLAVVAINANSLQTHPEDGPSAMRQLATAERWRFPFLFDSTQQTARAFHAACTPDFFLFDRQRRLAYRGQFDDSRPSNRRPVTGSDLAAAVCAVLAGQPVPPDQKPSIGCSIKWDPGNEPPSR